MISLLESEGLRGGDSVSGNRVTYCLNGAKPVITLAEDLAVEIRVLLSSFVSPTGSSLCIQQICTEWLNNVLLYIYSLS
jgi:hypothetical protein